MVAGLVLFGLAGGYYLATPDGPHQIALESTLDVTDCVPGQEIEVAFHIRNPTGRDCRIVGLAEC